MELDWNNISQEDVNEMTLSALRALEKIQNGETDIFTELEDKTPGGRTGLTIGLLNLNVVLLESLQPATGWSKEEIFEGIEAKFTND